MASSQGGERNRMRFNQQRTPATGHVREGIRAVKSVIGSDVNNDFGTSRPFQSPHEPEFTFHGRIPEKHIINKATQVHGLRFLRDECWGKHCNGEAATLNNSFTALT